MLFGAQQILNFLVFCVGYCCMDVSLIDTFWGILPLVPLTMLLVERIVIVGPESITAPQILVFCLVAVWGLRLFWHIGSRYFKVPPDIRYVELLKLDSQCPQPCRGFMTWLRNFFMQALASSVLTTPAIYIFWYSQPED